MKTVYIPDSVWNRMAIYHKQINRLLRISAQSDLGMEQRLRAIDLHSKVQRKIGSLCDIWVLLGRV